MKDLKIQSNQMNLTLMWQPPDESIDGYQISWEIENSSDQQSLDLSSLEITIPFLSMEKSYLFKVRSLFFSSRNVKNPLGRSV